MWPKLKLRNELVERREFFCDPENPFARFGGGGSDVKQAPTHTQPWGQLEQALAGLVVPGIRGMPLTRPQYYGGQRLAPMSPDILGYGQGALETLSGGMEDVYAPIYEQAMNRWEQEIAPSVMERFAGMGNALSGGAASALAREGENLMTDVSATVAPLYQEAQMKLPVLSQLFGTFEQGARQQPLDIEYQKWFERQPYGSPYVALGRDILSGGGARAMESYAKPGTDWGQVGGNLGSAAILARGLAKSDRRLKENLEPITNALERLKDISGWIFNFKDDPNRRAGVLAQNVKAVLPEAVEEKCGILYIRLDGVLALVVNAVNELANEVAEIRGAAVLN